VTEGDVLCGYMDRLAAVKATLNGNYTHLPKTYDMVQKYIDENGYLVDPTKKMFEIYINDPEVIENPAKWRTEVYIPILKPVEQ
jgi:effector-binding domain-containing protein